MLLGAKGTSRNLPKTGCALALNLIIVSSMKQQALLNLLLQLDKEGQVCRVELFRRSGHRSETKLPSYIGPTSGLFPTSTDNRVQVERPCVSSHYVPTPSFFHGDILALLTLVIQNHLTYLALSLDNPPNPCHHRLWYFLSEIPQQVRRRGRGSLRAPRSPQHKNFYLLVSLNHSNPWIPESGGISGDHFGLN